MPQQQGEEKITINNKTHFMMLKFLFMVFLEHKITLCNCLARVRLPTIIHLHWLTAKMWCGPRTCFEHKKCIPKNSILFIYVCTPEIINTRTNENLIQNWAKDSYINEMHTLCHIACDDCAFDARNSISIRKHICVVEWALNQNGRWIFGQTYYGANVFILANVSFVRWFLFSPS